MKEKEKISAVTQMIANEHWFIKWSVVLAVCFFCSGLFASIAITGFVSTVGVAEVLKGIPAIAGTGFGIFSIKDFLARKNKIVILQYISGIFSNSRNKELLEEANELFKGLTKGVVN